MITNKYVFDRDFNSEISDAYIGVVYYIKYKNKYARENEIMIDEDKEYFYLRNAFKFDEEKKTFTDFKLNENCRFMLLPYLPSENEQERSVLYISASSGSGKSYFVNMYASLYRKFYPNNKIFFLTLNNWKNDKSLTKDLYHFIDFNDFLEKYETQEDLEEFSLNTDIKDCFFIFDDIETAENDKKKCKTLYAIINIILNNKRKFKVSIAVISHLSTKYQLTRNIISEIKNYVIFPSNKQVNSDRILKYSLGLPKKTIQYITEDMFNTGTKWCALNSQRRYLLTQREIQFLK